MPASPSQQYFPVISRETVRAALVDAARGLGHSSPADVIIEHPNGGFEVPADVWAASGLRDLGPRTGG